jgi:glycosyltransferase involved in cell wall biosynthesis
MTPVVSVVTPCYDAEAFLPRTIQSVLGQTLSGWELVVVDDGSPGDFDAAMAPFRSDPRIHVLRQANGGLCRARNAGFALTSSAARYVLFLDADDVLEPEMLEVLVTHLNNHLTAGMAFCDRVLIDGDDRLIEAFRDDLIRRYVPDGGRVRLLSADHPDTPFASFFAYSIAVPSLTVLRRSVYEQVGGWDEGLGPFYEDTDMWLRVRLRAEAHYVPRRLVRRRLHGHQITRSPAAAARHRMGLGKFQRKWRQSAWLSVSERRVVAEALRFRERQLLPRLWLGWGRERWRRGEPVEAAKCWLRAARHLLPGT